MYPEHILPDAQTLEQSETNAPLLKKEVLILRLASFEKQTISKMANVEKYSFHRNLHECFYTLYILDIIISPTFQT